MHVAVHKSLQGDNLRGEDHMLRFLASSFNDKGQALDAMGSPCTDLACPHCHWKLPRVSSISSRRSSQLSAPLPPENPIT